MKELLDPDPDELSLFGDCKLLLLVAPLDEDPPDGALENPDLLASPGRLLQL